MCDINAKTLFSVNVVGCIYYHMYIWIFCVIE